MPTKKAKRKPVRSNKPATSKPSRGKPAADEDFESTFDGLKKVLSAFTAELQVDIDEPRKYHLVTKSKSWRGQHMFFGGVMQGKAYVSYHIMGLYMNPRLEKQVSPDLKKHKQGKACFNFRSPNDDLFRELREVTRACVDEYRAKKWL